jgi:RND family efflux transporter MFP subunit
LGLAGLLAAGAATAQDAEFTVEKVTVSDAKSVFATVRSADTVPARARISGTIVDLKVDEGSAVEAGAIVALVADEKLALRAEALDARIAAAKSEVENARAEQKRASALFERGNISKARLDQLDTALSVAENQLRAAEAERRVLDQQVTEGAVLAPQAGRVLEVPVSRGTVVLPGEPIAQIAIDKFILRLELPERHAAFIKEGDPIRVGARILNGEAPEHATGRITKVYPQLESGRVLADAEVEGLGDYFVGERVQAYISAGTRGVLLIPADFAFSRYGLHYVRLARDKAEPLEIAVELGRTRDIDGRQMVEVLSGLDAGDKLVRP